MASILSLVIIGLGGWAIYRFLSDGGPRQRGAGDGPPSDPKDLPNLKRDPKTGVYRPEDK